MAPFEGVGSGPGPSAVTAEFRMVGTDEVVATYEVEPALVPHLHTGAVIDGKFYRIVDTVWHVNADPSVVVFYLELFDSRAHEHA